MTAGARWVRFNLVGLLGFGVQAGFLWALVALFAIPAPIAVALAVFATVSHNFAWHERFTWPESSREGRLKRWLAFNATTGALSIAANVAITALVVRATGLPIIAANLLTVALLSLANFAVSDRVIFTGSCNHVRRQNIGKYAWAGRRFCHGGDGIYGHPHTRKQA